MIDYRLKKISDAMEKVYKAGGKLECDETYLDSYNLTIDDNLYMSKTGISIEGMRILKKLKMTINTMDNFANIMNETIENITGEKSKNPVEWV